MPTTHYYDIEDIIDETIDHLKDGTDGINAKITAVNAQKSPIDTSRGRTVMVMEQFKNTANVATLTENENLFFFMMDIEEEMVNNDPYMIISMPTWGSDNQGGNVTEIVYQIVVEDASDGTDPKRKLLRYLRCLREVLEDYLAVSDKLNGARLHLVAPNINDVFFENTSKSYYYSGWRLEFDYA